MAWKHYRSHGRHDLPWRKTRDPYRIMVSEVMLQQTQVSRVLDKYKTFLKRFPTMRALAKASLADVLKEWSGLGYNRRGKYLHDAAKKIVAAYGGKVPQDFAALRSLPGMGPYTASAVRVFAWNLPDVLIETNIRTVFFRHFFSGKLGPHRRDMKIDDKQILQLAHEAAAGQDPREWHYALMDYGAHLKRSGVRTNSRSKHYTKQSKFEGSLRQMRGKIVRDIANGKQEHSSGVGEKWQRALRALERDGLIVKKRGKWRIA